MCGAAAESILLSTAIAAHGEEETLALFRSANGRSRVEKKLLGQAREQLRKEISGSFGLLKYWRDEASHGGPSNIGDNEAFTSLATLLRLANLVDSAWLELMAPPKAG